MDFFRSFSVILVLFLSQIALADCEWVWIYRDGNYIQEQVCSDSGESPSISIPPIGIPPIDIPGIPPIDIPGIDPIGQTCTTDWVCDFDGECGYREVCR